MLRNIALTLALCATTLLSACAAESGNSGPGANANSWQQPSADAGSSDSGNAQADASNPDQQADIAFCPFTKVNTAKTWKCFPCEAPDASLSVNWKFNAKKCVLSNQDIGDYKANELVEYTDAPPPANIRLQTTGGSDQTCCVEAQ